MIWSMILPLEQLVECRCVQALPWKDDVYCRTNQGHLFRIVSGKRLVYLHLDHQMSGLHVHNGQVHSYSKDGAMIWDGDTGTHVPVKLPSPTLPTKVAWLVISEDGQTVSRRK